MTERSGVRGPLDPGNKSRDDNDAHANLTQPTFAACARPAPAAPAAVLLPHHVADGDDRGQDHGAEDVGAQDESIPSIEAVNGAAACRQEAVGEDDDEHHGGGEADGGGDVDELAHDWRHGTPPVVVGAPARAASKPPISTAAASSHVQPEAICERNLADSLHPGLEVHLR